MGTCIRFGLIDSDHDILDTYTSSMNSMDFLDSIDILDVSWMCLWIFCNYTGYAVMLCNWWPWACFCMGACRSCSQEYVSYCLLMFVGVSCAGHEIFPSGLKGIPMTIHDILYTVCDDIWYIAEEPRRHLVPPSIKYYQRKLESNRVTDDFYCVMLGSVDLGKCWLREVVTWGSVDWGKCWLRDVLT